jgi:hypothetical protein
MMQHAREALKAARGAFPLDGDPFSNQAMHRHVRRTLRTLADQYEPAAADVRELALAGAEDAHMALVDLIARRGARNEPLGPALSTYVDILADQGPPRVRRPAVRPPANFMASFVIICMAIDLTRRFPGLRRRRGEAGKRPSAFSVIAAVLNEPPSLLNAGEEAIRKIWEKYRPEAAPHVWRADRK